MLTLLRRVSLRDYVGAPARLALMIGGIASGVALIVALDIINVSVLANFRATLERAAGRGALQVALGTGELGFDEATIASVAADPAVEHAFGLVRGTLVAADASREVVQLFGVDLTSEAADSYDVERVEQEGDDIELLNDPSAVLLTREYAARRKIRLGDRVAFATPSGIRQLRVRGLLGTQGLATIFGGNLAVMDIAAAQRLLGKDRRVDQIDIVLQPDASVPQVRERLTARLPPSLTVNRPGLRGERFERAIGAFQAMLDGISILCLLAGVFIVYNASATAVTQRARDLAVLLALGAERRTVFALVVAESALVGMIASAVGIGVGLGLARLLLSLVAQSMGVIYQVRFSVESFELGWARVAWYMGLGTAAAVAATLVPALKASRLDPLDLMRPDYRERLAIGSHSGRLLALWAVLVVLAGVAVYLEDATRSIAWGNVGNTLWFLSVVTLTIPLTSWLCARLQRVLPRWFGVEGRIAAESLTRSPGRTGVTTAVIALSLALAVAVASIARSFRESERHWFILIGDLVVSSIGTEGGWLETPLAAEAGDVLERLPGVERVETYRVLSGQPYQDARIAVVGVSAGFVDTPVFRRQIAAGSAADAIRALTEGTGAVISDNLADRFHLRPGDLLQLPTPAGIRAFPVAGVVAADYSGDQGSVIVGRDDLARFWGDTQVSHFNVFLAPGTDLETVRASAIEALRDRYLVKVLTVPQTLDYHQNMVDRAFAFTYAIQLLVVAVTLAGIVDLLTTQVLERRSEVGILRALGADEPRIARAIRLEALVIGTAGAVIGAVLAVGTSLLWVHVNFRILLGYIVEHHFALWTAVSCVALAGGAAMLAGELAVRRALREPVLDSLRYE